MIDTQIAKNLRIAYAGFNSFANDVVTKAPANPELGVFPATERLIVYQWFQGGQLTKFVRGKDGVIFCCSPGEYSELPEVLQDTMASNPDMWDYGQTAPTALTGFSSRATRNLIPASKFDKEKADLFDCDEEVRAILADSRARGVEIR